MQDAKKIISKKIIVENAILQKIINTKLEKLKHKTSNLGFDFDNRKVPVIKPQFPLFIAEIKRKSPTLGHIGNIYDAVRLAKNYIQSGANAISVLCEEDYFSGSLNDLKKVKDAHPNICILRKDFILQKEEIDISYRAGADMILVIVAIFMHDKERFIEILEEIYKYNLMPLIEIHSKEELDFLIDIDLQINVQSSAFSSNIKEQHKINKGQNTESKNAHTILPNENIAYAPYLFTSNIFKNAIIGINSRNLKTFEIDKINACILRGYIANKNVIFESGLNFQKDAFIVSSSGFNGILCGSVLVSQMDEEKYNKDNHEVDNANNYVQKYSNNKNIESKNIDFSNQNESQSVKSNILKDFISSFLNGMHCDFYQKFFTLHKNNKTLLKICGINDLDFLSQAIKKAHLVGFILHSKSARFVDLEFLKKAKDVIKDSKVLKVGVILQEDFELGMRALELNLIDCLQLHHFSSWSKCEYKHYGSFKITNKNNINDFNFPAFISDEIKNAKNDFMLLDNSAGMGIDIDFDTLNEKIKSEKLSHLMLSGNVKTKNLKKILALNPMMIDVNSSLEISKALKDKKLLHEFMDEFLNIVN